MSAPALALYNLRGFVIIIVMAFHSVLAYLRYGPAHALALDEPPYQWRSFPIVDGRRWFGFDLFCAWQDLYLMSLMFFLSGLFVWSSLARKGSGGFLADRLMRIGLPFVLAFLVLMPLAHYPVYLASGRDSGLGGFWRPWQALPFWPTGPAWFLLALMVFDFAAAAAFRLVPGFGDALGRLCACPARLIIALLAASAVAYVPFALAFTPFEWFDAGPVAFQLSRPAHYAVYFFAGIGVGAHGIQRGLLKRGGWLARHCISAIAAAAASYVLWLGCAGLTMSYGEPAPIWAQTIVAVSYVLACAAGSLCALALAIRFADRRLPLLEPLSDNAYGLYLVHYVFVVWLQYILLPASLPAFIKGAIVLAGTLLASLATMAAVRRIPGTARVIGMADARAR